MKTNLFIAGLLLSISINGFSQSKKVVSGVTFQIENDLFAKILGIDNGDKDFSGGIKLELFTEYLDFSIFPLLSSRSESNYNSIYFTGFGLTPKREFLSQFDIAKGERPFASFIGFGRKRISSMLIKDYRFIVVSDFLVGKVGGESIGNAQNFIHEEILPSPEINGWQNQIGEGGRMGYKITYDLYCPIVSLPMSNIFIKPRFNFGNIVNVLETGLVFTTGAIENLPILSKIGYGVDNLPILPLSFNFEFIYKRVFHNTFLSGFKVNDKSTYTISDDIIYKNLLEFNAGIQYSFYPKKSESYKTTLFLNYIWRSKEFEGHDNHNYMSIGFNSMY